MIEGIIQLLNAHGIKPTPMRMLVLEQMMKYEKGVNLNEMERLLVDSDRVTIYRTLQTFVRHGVAHAIDMVNRGIIYALCAGDCTPRGHSDIHPHFICESCGKVVCAEDIPYALVKTPAADKYRINSIEVVIKGLCPACQSKK